jgi:hypothetical protein
MRVRGDDVMYGAFALHYCVVLISAARARKGRSEDRPIRLVVTNDRSQN